MEKIKKITVLLVCTCLLSINAGFSSAPDKVQLVQSVPIETDLAHPKLPLAKDVWLEMINGAQATIDLAQFYVSSVPGEAMDAILGALEKASTRGVRIRLLVSNALFDQDPQSIERFKKMKGAEVRVYNLSKLTGGILHAKYWIVDSKEAFVGSQNTDWRALTHIHELGVRFSEQALVQQLLNIFNVDWKVAETGQMPILEPEQTNTVEGVELVASPQQLNPVNTRAAISALLGLLVSAKKAIRVQLLDYSPLAAKDEYWPEIDNALRAAAVRQVKVQLLVSHWNTDKPAISHLKSLSLLPNIEIKIVTIPQWSGGFIPYARVIHSKYLLVDDEVMWIGTSNWSKGYFYNSRNVELIFKSPALNQQGQEVFYKLWNSMYAEKIDPLKDYPPPKKGSSND
mgnify:FL=1